MTDTYGLWTIRDDRPVQIIKHHRHVWCECTCGLTKYVRLSALRQGHTSGCAACTNPRIKHRLARTPEYNAWKSMVRRCTNPNSKGYHNYGGRGITVCPQWIDSPEQFVLDMGKIPEPGMSLDRIDVNGNYTPLNCRWATDQMQNRNRRDTIRIEYKGEIVNLIDLCESLGVNHNVVKERILRHDWDIEDALTLEPKRGIKYEQRRKDK